MRRRSVVLLSSASAALMAGIIGCSSDYTRPSGTLPARCVEAKNVPGTLPPGTDQAGSTLPPATVDKPIVTIPEGPLPTEMKINDVKVGDGPEVKPGDQVTVNYVGLACTTGEQFDSSYERGEPATFTLDSVIEGWREGLVGMKVGGRRELTIPGDKAYTDKNPPPGAGIGKFEPLFFTVDLLATELPPPTTTTAAPTTTTAPPSETPGTTTAPPASEAPASTNAP